MSSKKSLLQFPITGLSVITWHFSCEAQFLAVNYCNLYLPWSSPLPVSASIHIFSSWLILDVVQSFLPADISPQGHFAGYTSGGFLISVLIMFFFLRRNSSEYFKLSEKIECCPEAVRENYNRTIFIFWLGPLELRLQGRGKVRDHLLTGPLIILPCKTQLRMEKVKYGCLTV